MVDRTLIYPSLDVCVVPSRVDEALGMTAVEAAFFGLPVIASRKGGLQEVVRHEETGLLVAPESPGEIAAGLRRLADDAQLRASLGRRARELAIERFSIQAFGSRFSDVVGRGLREGAF